jgi:hypothetical protein
MKLLKPIASIAIIACSVPAWAQSFSSATISNVAVTLIDLDLNDGITPAITFNPAGIYNAWVATTLYEFHSNAPLWANGTHVVASSKFGPVTSSDAGPLISGSASVFGDGTLGGTVLQATGTSTSTPYAETYYFVDAGMLRDTETINGAEAFSLTAHTRVIFSADVDLFARVTNELGGASPWRSALANAHLVTFEPDSGSNTAPQVNVEDVYAQHNSHFADPGGTRVQQTTSVHFENLTSDWTTGGVIITAIVRGESWYASAVPEPASVVSLSCGLAFIAWRYRSRRVSSECAVHRSTTLPC